MASNLIVARGGVEYVPPISLSFLEMGSSFFIIITFYLQISKKKF